MPTTIAISGKGGVGKSTIAALIVRCLNEAGQTSVLAVDGDANVNLNDLLGVEIQESVGNIREEMRECVSHLPGGMSKQQFLEYKIHQSLVESEPFDLITMGRPEGPGCYCYANNLLREILQTLSENYCYVIIDNEAGMEHLSRRTTMHVDRLLIVSDPSVRGIQTAGRISRLIKELDTRVKEKFLIINRVQTPLTTAIEEQIKTEGLELLGTLPEDPQVRRWEEHGKPVYHLSDASPFYQTLCEMCDKIIPDYHSNDEEG
jgi:CO dehydrogenase maturation factor